MKKIFYLLIATAMFAGCEYLDKEPDDMKTDKMVWSNRAEVVKYLTNCYASLPMDRLHQDDPWLGCVVRIPDLQHQPRCLGAFDIFLCQMEHLLPDHPCDVRFRKQRG